MKGKELIEYIKANNLEEKEITVDDLCSAVNKLSEQAEVKKKKVIYIECENGVAFTKGEKIFLDGYMYSEGPAFYGFNSHYVSLKINPKLDDKDKLYEAFISWSQKLRGDYVTKQECSDNIILTDEEYGTVTFYGTIPQLCNYELNTFEISADWKS